MDIQSILGEIAWMGASDLHLVSWSPPMMRLNGRLEPLNFPQLSSNRNCTNRSWGC